MPLKNFGLAGKYTNFRDSDVAAVHGSSHVAFHHQNLAIAIFECFSLIRGAGFAAIFRNVLSIKTATEVLSKKRAMNKHCLVNNALG